MGGHDQLEAGREPATDREIRPRYQPLVVVLVALAAGMVVDRYAGPGLYARGSNSGASQSAAPVWFFAWCGVAAGCLVSWAIAWRKGRVAVAAWLLLCAVATTGAAWHDLRWNVFPRAEIARYARNDAEPACVEVIAGGIPQHVPAPQPTALRAIPAREQSRLDVQVVAIRDGTSWRPAAGLCRVTIDGQLAGVHAGDRLLVFGQLRRLAPPLNPGEFDFAAYARTDRELATLRSEWPACVTVVEPTSGWSFERTLDAVRDSGKRLLREYVGHEQAGLASAILLGSREGLPTEETNSFFVTGTIHVLVVSGLHVAVLALGLYAAMRLGLLPRKFGLAVIMGVVLAYMLVADARPPVMRAAVLTVVLCVAAWTGRRGVAFNSLAAAALAILVFNPSELFSTGTHLSFLCVATLVWMGRQRASAMQRPSDRLEELIAQSRPWPVRWGKLWARRLAWFMAITCVLWLAALPLVLYRFHVVTPIAILISPAVWALVIVAMWSGFATLLFGWLPPVAAVMGTLCGFALMGLKGLVDSAASVPAGHFFAPGPAAWWVAGFYIGLAIIMFWGRALVPRRWQLAALCLWIVAGVAPPLVANWTRDRLDCSFVAMGHGTCVVLQTPDGRTLVYDAGSLGSPHYAAQSVASYLWHRGIWRIDGLVLSHADVDHYNAVPELLERFHVGAIYVSPVMFRSIDGAGQGGGPAELHAAIDRAGVPLREIWSGDTLRIGNEVAARVLHPPRYGVFGSDNANSITLAVEYAGCRVLLPGDLESPGLEDVMAELPQDCDVLLAPHHGSRRSDPPGFAAWSTPEWVVISGGPEADASVTQTYADAGARVLNTGQVGAVELSIEERSVCFSTHKGTR